MAKKAQAKGKGGANGAQPAKRAARKPGELSRFQKGVIIVIVAVFALSSVVGAIASVVQSERAQDSSTYTVESADEQFQPLVDDLDASLADDPENADTLLSAASYCTQWGSTVAMLATTDAETSHANEILDRAIGYYDRYLELEDSNDARVSRALCFYYQEDTTAAVDALEEITVASPDYAPAWLDLGIIYEAQSNDEDAASAYGKALEADADGSQGVRDTAQERLDALTGTDEDESADEGSDEGTDAASGDAQADEGANATETGNEP